MHPFHKHRYSTIANIPVHPNSRGWYELDPGSHKDETYSTHKKHYYKLNRNPDPEEPDTQTHSETSF